MRPHARSRLTLVPLLLAGLALAAGPGAAQAAFPGDNGRIVFSSGGDLFTDAGPVTSTPEEEAQAAWSPDGRRLAFRVRVPGETALRIAVMNADGSGRTLVGGSDRHETQPGWSPDGSKLVFRRAVVGDNASGELWIMDADGTDARPLVAGAGTDERYPVLSPDGTRLAFTRSTGGNVDVLVAAADGTGAARVAADLGFESAPAWSPDASRLAFERGPGPDAAGNEIWTLAATGGDERRLTDDATLDEGPAWSPDGAQLAFTSRRGGTSGVWRMRADGTAPVVVADPPGDQESPDWQAVPRPGPGGAGAGAEGSPAAGAGAAGAAFPGPSTGPAATVDRDRDGLTLAAERRLRTSDLDRDSDDDGLRDDVETGFLPCMAVVPRCLAPVIRRGDPRRFDTDGDGLPDGLERGVRRGVPDPPGPVRGTATRRFRPDRDPRTRTDALRRDTDRDGVRDGREDRNGNGRRDRGERDPRRRERRR